LASALCVTQYYSHALAKVICQRRGGPLGGYSPITRVRHCIALQCYFNNFCGHSLDEPQLDIPLSVGETGWLSGVIAGQKPCQNIGNQHDLMAKARALLHALEYRDSLKNFFSEAN
jgi:hypothetical protein